MVKKILIGLAVALVLFIGFVASRDGHFRYERSGVINAKPEVIYPYISDFKLGHQWSPYEKDAEQKNTYGGTPGQVGSFEEWDGKQMGQGRIEITQAKPNEQVDLRLQMIKPIAADNHVTYKLTPEGNSTRFTWIMEGNGGFFGKLMGVVIDCEKMIAGQFEEGIANLKKLVEKNGA